MWPPACPGCIGEDVALEPLEDTSGALYVCAMGGMAWNALWPTCISKMAVTILVCHALRKKNSTAAEFALLGLCRL